MDVAEVDKARKQKPDPQSHTRSQSAEFVFGKL